MRGSTKDRFTQSARTHLALTAAASSMSIICAPVMFLTTADISAAIKVQKVMLGLGISDMDW
jgi:hypothetical protein